MALILRKGVRCCGIGSIEVSKLFWKNSSRINPWIRPMAAIADKEGESFWDKNKRLQRPLSPHMGIYKWEITQNMSLAHRTTGLLMTTGLYGFAIGMMTLPGTFPYYFHILQEAHLSPVIIYSAKFVLAFPLMFHLCSGLRHLVWDLGKGFSIKSVYLTGYTAVAVATALTAVIASL